MNILFTSVGRRSYIINYFKNSLGGDGEIYVANSSDDSPAFLVADHTVVTPLIYDENYIPFLLQYCKDNHIKAIISLFDVDLPILAKNREKFCEIGVKLIVSDEKVITICNDKWETFKFLSDNDFCTPLAYLSIDQAMNAIKKGKVDFPLIVKPRWGMGSAATYSAYNNEELKIMYELVKREVFDSYLKYESASTYEHCVVIQERLDGQEYGLDVFNDLDANYVSTIAKKKIAMRAGETDIAQTISDCRFISLGEKLGKTLDHIGNLDVDVLEENDKLYVIDLNARFGGGYPFSHLAGANLPYAIIQWLQGKQVDESILNVQNGVVGQKDINMVRLR